MTAPEPMTMGQNVQRRPLPLLLLLFFFFHFFGYAGSSLPCRLFSSVASRGYSLVAVHRLLPAVASLAAEHRHSGFSSCSTRAQ